jgi:MFS superfamily sulfate permease-like transporter
MNLIGCWVSAMPVCHGSGGLAAQYRFGARSGASIIFLGTLKIIIGLFASELILEWCRGVPDSVLSILLILAGTELVKMGENVNSRGARDLWEESTEDVRAEEQESRGGNRFVEPDAQARTRRYLLMMITVAATLVTHNVGVGFLAGMGIWLVFKLQDWDARRREGQIQLGEERSGGGAETNIT